MRSVPKPRHDPQLVGGFEVPAPASEMNVSRMCVRCAHVSGGWWGKAGSPHATVATTNRLTAGMDEAMVNPPLSTS
jgi:hypothetical protein